MLFYLRLALFLVLVAVAAADVGMRWQILATFPYLAAHIAHVTTDEQNRRSDRLKVALAERPRLMLPFLAFALSVLASIVWYAVALATSGTSPAALLPLVMYAATWLLWRDALKRIGII